jgi:hypothetical protein
MTDTEGSTPRAEGDAVHQGFVSLAALGIAVLLIVAAGVVGVTMSMAGDSHVMMWGGSGPAARAAGAEQATSIGFQLDGMPAHMVAHYEYARANAETYAQVPCFCGCQDMLAHRNLEDCFVTPDGAWESHASGCQVCIDESQMIMRMMGRGMGPQMMRERIVARFGGPMMGM